MVFILLHSFTGGREMYLNADSIEAVIDETEEGKPTKTRIIMASSDAGMCRETVAEVMEKMMWAPDA